MKLFIRRKLTLLLLLMFYCSFCGAMTTENKTSFYVAKNGNDSNIGSQSKPFKTLLRAQKAVRKLVEKGLDRDVEIVIRSGTYHLDKTLRLTVADSGTNEHSITWRNFENEKVRISGGRKISATWIKTANNIWTCPIPQNANSNWQFRDLFVDGKRQLRARWPNISTDKMTWIRDPDHHLHPNVAEMPMVVERSEDRKTLTLDSEIPVAEAQQDIELVHFKYWSTNRGRVSGVKGNSLVMEKPVGIQDAWYTELRVKDRVYLENSEAFLDRPGEWVLRPDNTLLYMCKQGQTPDGMDFVRPRLTTLLEIVGSPDAPVINVHFVGSIFEHTNWQLPENGYRPVQATFEGSSDGTIPASIPATAAIKCTYVTNLTFDRCKLQHTGANGLWLGLGCRKSKITNSEFIDIGGNGIMLGDPASRHETVAQTQYLTVENNLIKNAGQVQFGAVGIWVGYVKDTTIVHNEFCDLPYTAISAGWQWSPKPTVQQDCRIRYNYIHNVMQCMTDGGAIYMLGFQPRSDISHNIIIDVLNGNGLYADQGACELLFEGNVVDSVGFGDAVENMGHGYYQHLESRDVKVVNNLFMRSRNELVSRREPKPLGHLAVTFSGNIFVSSGEIDREILWQDSNEFERQNEYAFKDNCYYRTDDKQIIFIGKSWEQWQAMGNDTNSKLHTNSKPIFVDPTHAGNNYSLKPEQFDVLAIDFKPFQVHKAGRYPLCK